MPLNSIYISKVKGPETPFRLSDPVSDAKLKIIKLVKNASDILTKPKLQTFAYCQLNLLGNSNNLQMQLTSNHYILKSSY